MSLPDILSAARCMLVAFDPGKTNLLMFTLWERKRERIRDRVTVNFLPGSGERPMTALDSLSNSVESSPSSCAISPS